MIDRHLNIPFSGFKHRLEGVGNHISGLLVPVLVDKQLPEG